MFSISMIWLADQNDTAQVLENARHFNVTHMQMKKKKERILARPRKTYVLMLSLRENVSQPGRCVHPLVADITFALKLEPVNLCLFRKAQRLPLMLVYF